jgi:NDP-sugar pyrophosphorylase family protein
MLQFHRERQALATLAVQNRQTSRYLLFDERGQICGRRSGPREAPVRGWTGDATIPTKAHSTQDALAFSGIHVISPRIFSLMAEEGAFSIIDTYLRLASQREKIFAFRADEYYWRDLGRPENIAEAERDIRDRVFVEDYPSG